MKITRWEHERHGPLSETAVRGRFNDSVHRLFRRHIPEPARMVGVAEARILVPLSGGFRLYVDGQQHDAAPGDVVDLHGGSFTFTCEGPVTFMAVYRLPAGEWPQ